MRKARLKLPATSANLGPGFDALALALALFLEIEAASATEFSMKASGRSPEICAALTDNLLIETYRQTLAGENKQIVPLAIRMQNGIPLGMGCGSSAAARLAGVALASHFGGLGWSGHRIVEAAACLEGHPDNVAACWFGGFTIAAAENGRLNTLSIPPPPGWRAILALPERPVATTESRGVLPQSYSRADVVGNVQNVALLTAAFASGKAGLLVAATGDRLHQPYRAELCPLLPALLPLAGRKGILSVTLSGAGPAVLLLHAGGVPSATHEIDKHEILAAARGLGPVELVDAPLWGERSVVTSEE